MIVKWCEQMTIEISKGARKEAIASVEQNLQENMEERIGYETVFTF